MYKTILILLFPVILSSQIVVAPKLDSLYKLRDQLKSNLTFTTKVINEPTMSFPIHKTYEEVHHRPSNFDNSDLLHWVEFVIHQYENGQFYEAIYWIEDENGEMKFECYDAYFPLPINYTEYMDWRVRNFLKE